MRKGTKITLIVLGSIFAFIGILFIVADLMLSSLLTKEVNKALTQLPGCEASIGGCLPPVGVYLRWAAYLRWVYTSGGCIPSVMAV